MPTEHGSWAFVLEPLLVVLIATRSQDHSAMLWASLFGFLIFRPTKLALTDLLKRHRYPRTVPALIAALVGVVGIGFCLWVELPYLDGQAPWLSLAGLLAILFILFDRFGGPRSLARELIGAVLVLPLAAAAIEHGAQPLTILLLLGMLAGRAWSAVFSVRSVFKRTPDWQWCRVGALASCALMCLCWWLLWSHAIGWPVPLYLPVVLRTLWLVATPYRVREAKTVGVHESIMAVTCVLCWVVLLSVSEEFYGLGGVIRAGDRTGHQWNVHGELFQQPQIGSLRPLGKRVHLRI